MHIESLHIRRQVIPPYRGALLVAEPFLDEGCFRRSVICLAEYSEKGAVGFVLNSPTRYFLNELLVGAGSLPSIPVYCGGPVGTDHLFFLHDIAALPGAVEITEGLFANGDFDMLLDEESQARQTMVSNLESTGALSGLGVDTQGFLNALFEGMEYEIASVEVDDEAKTATATVELTCKSLTDVATRAQELLNQRAADAGETAISPEETLAWMGECLMQAAREDAPESVELELDCSSDDEGTWSADDSVAAAVAGALLG